MTASLSRSRPGFGLPGRIQAPNSQPRSIAIVGLGEGGAAVARRIPREGLAHLDVHVLAKNAGADALAAIQAGGGDLQRDLQAADMIFIVACRGDDVALACVVSGIARACGHSVTGIYLVAPDELGPEDAALCSLRKSVEMLVVVSDESYVTAMINALGG